MRIIDNEYDRKELEAAGLIGRMKLVRLTPDLAQKWLQNNSINRPMTEKHIERFCEVIRAGLWVPAANIFQMASNLRFLNGQHRCMAVIRTGITVYAWVCCELSEKVYNAIDTELRKRAIADLLPRDTISRMNIGAITNAIWNVKYNEWPKLAQQSLDLYYEYEDDIHWAWDLFSPKKSIYPAGVIAAFAYAHSASKITKKVEKFADELVTGVGREAGALSIVLERACLRTPKVGMENRKNIQRRTLRAIQFYCEGKKAEKLQETMEGVNWLRRLLDEAPIQNGDGEHQDS